MGDAVNVDHYRARRGDRHALERYRPSHTGALDDDAATKHLEKGITRLEELQQLLYAQDRYALLLILQGMDAAGKDHVIKHVMSGLNPQGTQVHSFKQPSSEDLQHDFLWRASKVLPERGHIGIFNRSYYEEVLVVRVHRPLLDNEKLPRQRVTKDIWQKRLDDITAFERHLWRNGTVVVKIFLHISKREQEQRLLERLDDPAKNWKFSSADLIERAKWKAYQKAYADAIAATSHDHAPWYVVPANHKWFAQAVVADIVIDALEQLKLAYPPLTAKQRRELAAARRRLIRATQ